MPPRTHRPPGQRRSARPQALRGGYPYPFIDALALGYPRVLVNTAGLLVIFALLCLGLLGLGRCDRRRPSAPQG